MARAWRSDATLKSRVTLVAILVPLATPYAMFYDLTPIVLPLLWAHQRADQTPDDWRSIVFVSLAWLAPILLWLLPSEIGISLWPVALAIGCWIVLRKQPTAATP